MLKASDRQDHRSRGRDVVLRQPGSDPQHLLLGKAVGREADVEFASRVGRAAGDALVGESDLDRPVGNGCSVLIFREDVGLDRVAAVIDRLLQVEAQVNGLKLIGLNVEHPGEFALPRLVHTDGVCSLGSAAIERQRLVKGSEFGQRDGPGNELSAPAIRHLESIPGALRARVLAALHLANHAPDGHLLSRPISGPIRVDVSSGREPLRHRAGNAQTRAGHVAAIENQVAQVLVRIPRRRPVVQQNTVGPGLGLEHDRPAVRHQHPGPGPALPGFHVLCEYQHLFA